MDKKKSKTALVICYLILFILLIVLIVFFAADCMDYSKGTKTEATVTEVIHKRVKNGNGKNSSKRTILHISYYADNEKYETTVDLSGNKRYSENDTITISYDPDEPENICAKNRLFQEMRTMIYYSIFFVIMVSLLIRSKRKATE
jgi:Protein of unknown function (DUF3592).